MLSILVAFRDTDGTRTRLWTFIRGMFERHLPDAEIVVGTDDGTNPFHKTLALNRAAAEATGDVFMLADADTWVAADRIRAAEEAIRSNPRDWYRPWNVKMKLRQEPTEQVLAQGLGWDGTVAPRTKLENANHYWAAPPLLLHRNTWAAVKGIDERFRGWGHEDDAFARSLVVMFGRPQSLPGPAIHLHHHRIGRSGRDLWRGQESPQANGELAQRYRRARTPDQMLALIAEREEALV